VITVRVNTGDGPRTVQVGTRAVIAWERAYKRAFTDAANPAPLDAYAFMAYTQLGYDGARDEGESYNQWLANMVGDMELVPDESPT
jgi:hypothetical protein